jgi:hypothetical protein
VHALHRAAEGDSRSPLYGSVLAEQVGLTKQEADATLQYLAGEGLIESVASEWSRSPIMGSQVQQGTTQSEQRRSVSQCDVGALRDFVQDARRNLSELQMSAATREEIAGDISVLETRVALTTPRRGIISEALKSLLTVLEGAGGGVAGALLLVVLLDPSLDARRAYALELPRRWRPELTG